MYLRNHFYCKIDRAHSKDVDAVDETNNIVISGSADGVVKAWTSPKNQEFMSNLPLATVTVHDRVWSIAADSSNTKVAIGTSGTSGVPLYIYDTKKFVSNALLTNFLHYDFFFFFLQINVCSFDQSYVINHNWIQGAGILDMVWDDPHTLLTCGYDTCIRKWDLRYFNSKKKKKSSYIYFVIINFTF